METTSYVHMFWGYAAIWFIFGVYLVSLGNRINKIEKKISKKK